MVVRVLEKGQCCTRHSISEDVSYNKDLGDIFLLQVTIHNLMSRDLWNKNLR